MPDETELEIENPTDAAPEAEVPETPEVPTPPDAEAPDAPAEPLAEPETTEIEPAEEPEEEIIVPTVVQNLAPAMAAHWGSMTEEQRGDLMADLVGQIDRGEPEGEGDDTDTQDEPEAPVESEPIARTQAPEAPPETAAPSLVSDADLAAACEEWGIEPDSAAAKLLRATREQAAHAVKTSDQVARDAMALYDATKKDAQEAKEAASKASKDVRLLAEENEWIAAMDAYAVDLRGYNNKQLREVLEEARGFKRSGRAGNPDGALCIAIWERQKTASPQPSPKAKEEAERVASALSAGSRSRAIGKDTKFKMEDIQNPSDIAKILDARMRRQG